MFSMGEIIDIAIHLEKNGEAYYRRASDLQPDPSVARRLNWLADQEAAHVETFLDMKRSIKIQLDDPSLLAMGQRLFEEVVGHEGFSLSHASLNGIGKTGELLSLAVEFEKDTIIFYELLRSFIKETPVLELLDEIIAEEHGHVRELTTLLEAQTA